MPEDDYDEMEDRWEPVNEELLARFTNFVITEKIVGKIRAHQYADSLRFFGNDYLAQYEEGSLLDGLASFPSFVGNWFIRKAMWSDAKAVRANVEAFGLFIRVFEGWGEIEKAEFDRLNEILERNLEMWCLRADCYNNPELDVADLFDESGQWKDEMIRVNSKPKEPRIIPGTRSLALNLLLSAKVAKFCGIKPPELVKMANQEEWEGSVHSWFSNWRCEEAFGMRGTKEKVILVTNERSRYSVLIRIPGKDPKALLVAVHSAIMRSFDRFEVPRPVRVELAIRTLSGAARSLTSFQNQLMYHLDHLVDRRDFEFLDDLEIPLNDCPTKMYGRYEFPDRVFPGLCEEDPPFGSEVSPDVIVPFLN